MVRSSLLLVAVLAWGQVQAGAALEHRSAVLPIGDPARRCHKARLNLVDHSLSGHAFALLYHDVQFHQVGQGVDPTVSLPASCVSEVRAFPYEESRLIFGSTKINRTDERLDDCRKLKGIWLVVGDRGHGDSNLFEDLSNAWYPSYLALRSHLNDSQVRVTHAGGTKRGWLAFPDVYASFGTYKPWDVVMLGEDYQYGDAKDTTRRCVQLETVVAVAGAYSWIGCPVHSHFNPHLAAFVNHLVHHMAQGLDTEPPQSTRCRRLMVYSRRVRDFRNITNEDEVVNALVTAFPQFEVVAKDFATESLYAHASLLRQAHVFVFPHGGEGPCVMFLPHGASVVELMPYGFSDPMYRNMAILTGKTYFVWQNTNITRASGQVNSRNSNTQVDIPSVLEIVKAAATAASFSVADLFTPLEQPFEMKRENFGCGSFNLGTPQQGCVRGPAAV